MRGLDPDFLYFFIPLLCIGSSWFRFQGSTFSVSQKWSHDSSCRNGISRNTISMKIYHAIVMQMIMSIWLWWPTTTQCIYILCWMGETIHIPLFWFWDIRVNQYERHIRRLTNFWADRECFVHNSNPNRWLLSHIGMQESMNIYLSSWGIEASEGTRRSRSKFLNHAGLPKFSLSWSVTRLPAVELSVHPLPYAACPSPAIDGHDTWPECRIWAASHSRIRHCVMTGWRPGDGRYTKNWCTGALPANRWRRWRGFGE